MANDPRFEVYPRKAGMAPAEVLEGPDPEANWPIEFGWRFRAANGQISAVSGEGFTRRENAHRAIWGVAADTLGAVLGMEAKPFADIFEKPDAVFPTRIIDVDE